MSNWLNDWRSTSTKLGGICKTQVFKLWGSGDLGSVTMGRRRFSTDEQIAVFIRQLEAASLSSVDTTD